MKKIILGALLFVSSQVNAQWCAKNVDNGLDEPYKICYNRNIYDQLLKMENNEGKIMLYLKDELVCEQLHIDTDLSLLVNGVWQKYKFSCNSYSGTVLLTQDIYESEEFVTQFKAASKIKFRLNYEDCIPVTYEFSMLASSSSLLFISKL